jgi:hypothetical protein
VPVLVGQLESGVAEELLPRAIVAQGPAAVEPLLALARSARVPGFDRGLAAQLALACATDVGPVCAALRDLLRALLDRDDAETADGRSLICSLALDLAHVPDRAAEPLLRRAARLDLGGLTSEAELVGLLAAAPVAAEPLDWLAEYQERYDECGYDEIDP